MTKKFIKNTAWLVALLLALCIAFTGCDISGGADWGDGGGEDPSKSSQSTSASTTQKPNGNSSSTTQKPSNEGSETVTYEQRDAEKALGVPAFSGKPYAELNGNMPTFKDNEITTKAYERYSELDELGRCGITEACIGKELMPTEDREGSLSSVTPTGWVNNRYDSEIVSGGYIYNRAHLIGWQLTAETTNKQNLITGTRFMNVEGMLPFENMVADYIKETDNHVMYRVTPIFDGNDLVACGVQMEAYSVEDDEIRFNVYIYNAQPGIVIDFATGENWLSGEAPETPTESKPQGGTQEKSYVLNTSSKVIHKPTCSSVSSMSENNKREYTGDIQDLLNDGYSACGRCKPAA